MPDALTIPAKYIYLDVVNFTQNRSVEAQVDVVHALNSIVTKCISDNGILSKHLILIPTGDGICIALLNVETPYDIHMRLALDIIKEVHSHNETTASEMRRFAVRIGINANTDNLITDINSNSNIAGAGINIAQRVMDTADGNQIIVSQAVYETLRHRELYMEAFKEFQATVKHGIKMPVFQFIAENHVGLNTDEPSVFQAPKKAPEKLDALTTYYFAHAIKNRQFFLTKKDDLLHAAGTILLWFLAQDSIITAQATEVSVVKLKTHKAADGNIAEQYAFYRDIDFYVGYALFEFIKREEIPNDESGYYEGLYGDRRFISAEGMNKLKQDWPAVWESFELDKYVSDADKLKQD